MKKFTLLCAALSVAVFSANAADVFFETCGPQVSKVGNFWPTVADYTAWDNKAPIAFAGGEVFESVRWVASLGDASVLGTHVYLAANKNSVFTISNIPAVGYTNLKLSFTLASHEKLGGSSDLVKLFVNDAEVAVPVKTIPGDNKDVVQIENIAISNADAINLKFTSTNTIGIRIDNFKITGDVAAGLDDQAKAALNFIVNGNEVSFYSEEVANVSVFSMTGAQLMSKKTTIGNNTITINKSGLYIVKVGSKASVVRL